MRLIIELKIIKKECKKNKHFESSHFKNLRIGTIID